MGKAYVIVEGHGENSAVENLLTRLWQWLKLPHIVWAKPKRLNALHTEAGVRNACELLRKDKDCERALILRDEDDGCPAEAGPETALWVERANLPFPVAVVLAHREYEAWFLPCIHLMVGKPLASPKGIPLASVLPEAKFGEGKRPEEIGEAAEKIRGVKEYLRDYFPKGRPYKPTTHQLALTRLIDFQVLRDCQMPCFLTLENALRFLANPGEQKVYPPPKKE